MKLITLTSHPIQYQAPLFRELAQRVDLLVLFAHRATREDQAKAGFGVGFEWDIDLTQGYRHRFLVNRARQPGIDRFSGTNCPEIADILEQERPDAVLVMGWQHRAYWQAILAARKCGIPLLVRGESQLTTRRSLTLRLAKEIVYRVMLRMFDGCLYIGRRNKEYLRHYGVSEKRLFFSPYCVDNERFARSARDVDIAALKKKVGISQNQRVALFCGKLIEKKRPLDCIRAIGLLPSQERPVLLVVGSGPLEERMRREAAIAGVDARFIGFQNQTQLPQWYALADLLLLPSDGGETWGLVVNEAMACGTPAVVSDAVGCGPDLIEPGRTGDVFRLGDHADFAAKIEATIDLKQRSGTRAALEEKLSVYSIERAAAGIIEAIEAVSGQGR